MNRWFVAALITLALIVLVSPGIVGRLAEKSVEENLNFATSESDEIVVTTESYERGWFTSEGRHRIEARDAALRSLLQGTSGDYTQAPSLLIDTHIDHGLLPVSSMSRDAGSLRPALASTVSTIKLDPGNGELIDIPGKIYSEVGLTGETATRFVLDAGSRQIADKTLEFQGADITVLMNPANRAISVEGTVQPWSLRYKSEGEVLSSIEVGSIAIEGNQQISEHGFAVGSIHLEMGSVDIDNGIEPPFGLQSLSLHANTEVDGDRINATSKLVVSGVSSPASGEIGLSMDVVLNRLDAASAYKVAQVLQNAQSSADPQAALADMYPRIAADLQKLLTSGLEVRIDKFDVSLPNGELTTKLRFDLPASDPDAVFSWPALLLALNASADLRLPVELYQMAETMSPDVRMLVAMGILKKHADYYEMRAEYAKGLITVNGAPMPMPLLGL
ncbi:MAG: DUF945 family protein [Gammaproteobacteria bacterium]|nr:DUF945 family protein [Gammaproteobacteria bacterium]